MLSVPIPFLRAHRSFPFSEHSASPKKSRKRERKKLNKGRRTEQSGRFV